MVNEQDGRLILLTREIIMLNRMQNVPLQLARINTVYQRFVSSALKLGGAAAVMLESSQVGGWPGLRPGFRAAR